MSTLSPMIGPRSRYHYVTMQHSWLYHKGALNGNRVTRATQPNPDLIDPNIVRGGYIEFNTLNNGGLFYELGKCGRAIEVYAIDKSNADVISSVVTVNFKNPAEQIRDITSLINADVFTPFVLAPYEILKVVASGTTFGLMVKIFHKDERL